MCKFWSFHVVLHRMADKCTKIYNAGEQSKYVEDNFDCKNMNIYYIKVSGIASGNKLIKAIRYLHM